MSLYPYDLISSEDRLSFEFYSDGPKGEIKKVVQYTKLKRPEIVYNLGFGDFNPETGEIDDLSVSNNADRDKVLQTVASTVPFFFGKYPDAQVTFEGSTDSRTRLYIREISKHLEQLSDTIVIEGLTTNGWESFEKNRRYIAISVIKKFVN